MNRNTNTYTLLFSVIMVIVVATILTIVAISLQPAQKRNIKIEKKKNILSALNIPSDARNATELYDKYIIESFAVNLEGDKVANIDAFNIDLKKELKKNGEEQLWPVYICSTEEGNKYLFALYGKGLWGPIWGYIALNDDLNSVYGVYFDHKSETPGLGAEISTQDFQNQFKNKTLFDQNDIFISIDVVKSGAGENPFAVDAVSGGTITSNGLRDMIKSCMTAYLGYIEKNKK
ncbi:MAG: NADH:ubiquinone reductase (Na(+)-transporting) subunit C [Bacteroidales bacterium]|nr:NADH:ubiquinone reductase (Na(+)-transporting) subunit C [Bacteroidales bacterium]